MINKEQANNESVFKNWYIKRGNSLHDSHISNSDKIAKLSINEYNKSMFENIFGCDLVRGVISIRQKNDN